MFLIFFCKVWKQNAKKYGFKNWNLIDYLYCLRKRSDICTQIPWNPNPKKTYKFQTDPKFIKPWPTYLGDPTQLKSQVFLDTNV